MTIAVLRTLSQTATNPEDFIEVRKTLNFEPGVNELTEYIHIQNDNNPEDDEFLQIELFNPSEGVLGTIKEARINIIDSVKSKYIILVPL